MTKLGGYGIMIICTCIALNLFFQCKPSSSQDASGTIAQESGSLEKTSIDPSTARMASLIAAAFEGIDFRKTPYFGNESRLTHFAGLMQSADYSQRMNAWGFYANELLNGGYSEQAIQELHKIINELMNLQNSDAAVRQYMRLLALAYLRLAEQTNCIGQRNNESCIIPISSRGQFQMTQGSETAMQLCLDLLNRFGRDEEAIWILNLAAMTIGQYPQGIPEQWRIPYEHFDSGTTFPKFEDVSIRVGIRGNSLAGGACIDDFDGDGWLDILTSSWGARDPLTMWKNDGQGGFVNKSSSLGLEGINGGLNLIPADINNDGFTDILVLRGSWLFGEGKIPNSLLIGNGEGAFRDATVESGILTYAPTQTAAFADFNLDGWIDLFVGNESTPQALFKSEFYLNKGNGTFQNVIDAIGVSTGVMVKGCIAGDVNNDGWPDLYISNYVGPNLLLMNQGLNAQGIPQFINVAAHAGIEEPLFSFPTWIWDYNNDGWEDIFVSSYGDGTLSTAKDYVQNGFGIFLGGQPRIYRNNRNGTFTDISTSMGLRENVFTMGCNFGDLDADGYLDFYLGTGNPEYTSAVPNKMYRNVQAARFEDVTAAGGFGNIHKGHAVAFGDLDRDGDEDIFESMGGAFEGDLFEDVLYENPVGQNKSWIVLKLEGSQSNRMAIGARVKVSALSARGKYLVYRTVCSGGSFGANSMQLEIGLNDATAIDAIEITWPIRDRKKQVFKGVEMNRYVRIVEGNSAPEYLDISAIPFR